MEFGFLERELMEMLWSMGRADARGVYEAVRKKEELPILLSIQPW